MASKTKKLKYQVILEEVLAGREWEDELEIDADARKVQLSTGISFGGHGGQLIIEASDETDFVDVFIYYDVECKAAKIGEMLVLLSEIHRRWIFGHFTCLPSGAVRWSHRVDFEGSSPTALSIERILQPGWSAAGRFADPIAAVALTRQSAKDAIAEFDEAQAKETERSDGDGPSEL